MSNAWSIFIIVLVIINIALCWWLMQSNSKRRKDEQATTGHVWDDDLEELNKPLPLWWLWLFYITIIFSVIYLILYPGLGNFKGLLAWTQTQEYETEVKQASKQYADVYAQFVGLDLDVLSKNDQALKYGQRLFANNCSLCHGSDARGAHGFPNLADKDWLYGGQAAQILESILNGRNGIMTAFANILDEKNINDTAAYVMSLSSSDSAGHVNENGQTVFATYCAACHGADAKGNPLLGAPNLSDDIWLHGNSMQNIKQAIRNGFNSQMPPQRDILGEEKSRLVAAYLLSLQQE